MCVYCYCGDKIFEWDQPWEVPSTDPNYPYIPKPKVQPKEPWDLTKLKEYEELLRRIKELEDQIGCPCEPNKANYLEMFRKRIEELEKKVQDGRR